MGDLKWNKYKKEKGHLHIINRCNKIHIYLDNRGSWRAKEKYHVWDEVNLKTIGFFDTIRESKNAAAQYVFLFLSSMAISFLGSKKILNGNLRGQNGNTSRNEQKINRSTFENQERDGRCE